MINKIIELCKKYKGIIFYLIFGVLTTVINMVAYYLLCHYKAFENSFDKEIAVIINTTIAWILAVAFAYVTNKKWVFESKAVGFKENFKECMSFLSCRIATGIMDIVIMYIFVGMWHFPNMIMKFTSNVLVVILNYVGSKLFVFKDKVKEEKITEKTTKE